MKRSSLLLVSLAAVVGCASVTGCAADAPDITSASTDEALGSGVDVPKPKADD